MSFLEPFRRLFGLQFEISFGSTDLDLNGLGLRDVCFCARIPVFLLRSILESTIVHYFCNGWRGVGGDLDQIESFCLCHLDRILFGKDTKVDVCIVNNPEGRGADLSVDAYFFFHERELQIRTASVSGPLGF